MLSQRTLWEGNGSFCADVQKGASVFVLTAKNQEGEKSAD